MDTDRFPKLAIPAAISLMVRSIPLFALCPHLRSPTARRRRRQSFPHPFQSGEGGGDLPAYTTAKTAAWYVKGHLVNVAKQ